MDRLSCLRRRPAGRSTTEQSHDAQAQASANKGGYVERDERHDDEEKFSIHGKHPIRSAGDLLGLATCFALGNLGTTTRCVKC